MAYTLEQIEYLHDIGVMPDWAYYQQNGKTAQKNYDIQHQKIQTETRRRIEEKRRSRENEKQIEKEIEYKVSIVVNKVLNELFKDFNN